MEMPSETSRYGLTHQELAVLSLIAEGMSDEQVAQELEIHAYLVSSYLGDVLKKMGAKSRTEAAVRAIKEGFLPRPQDGG